MKKLSIVVLSIFMIFALFTGCNNEVPAPEGMGTPAYTENLESNGAFKVGNKSYETLDLAVKAIVAAKQALNEEVIVLTRDVTGRGATIPAIEGAAIIIDLDGHKLTFTDNAIVVEENAYFGITNGEISIYSKNAQFSAIEAGAANQVVIKDLTISVAKDQVAIDVDGALYLSIDDVTVNSGNSKSADQNTVVVINNVGEAKVTDSEINGTIFASGYSDLSIADSEINGTVLASASELTIGKEVDVDVVLADATQLIVAGGGHVTLVGCEGEKSTIVCQNGESAVTIGPDVDTSKVEISVARWKIVSSTDTSYYGNLNEAAAAAEDGATITAVFDQSTEAPEEAATITGKTLLTINLDNKPQKVDIILDGSNVAVESGALFSNVTGTGDVTFDKVTFYNSSDTTNDAVNITGSLYVYDSTIGGSVDVTGNLTVDSNGEAIAPISGNITVGGNMYAEGSNTNIFGAAKTVVTGDLSLVGKNSFAGTVKVSGDYITKTTQTTFFKSVELAGSSNYDIKEGKFCAGLVYSGTGSLIVKYETKDEDNFIKNLEDTNTEAGVVILANGIFKVKEDTSKPTDYYLQNVVSNIGSQVSADNDRVDIILLSDSTLTDDLDFGSNTVTVQNGVSNTSAPVIYAAGFDFKMKEGAVVMLSRVVLDDSSNEESTFVADGGWLLVNNGATLNIQVNDETSENTAIVWIDGANATKSIYAENVSVVDDSTIGTSTASVPVVSAKELVQIAGSKVYAAEIKADEVRVTKSITGDSFTTGNLGAITAKTDAEIKYATVDASSITAKNVSVSGQTTAAHTTVTFVGENSGIVVGDAGTVTVSDGAIVMLNSDNSGIVAGDAATVTVKTGALVDNDNSTNGCGIKVGKAGTVTVDNASVTLAGYSGIILDNGGSFTAKDAIITGYVFGGFNVEPDFSKYFDVVVTDSLFVGTIGNAYGEVTSETGNKYINLNLTSDASARAVDTGDLLSVNMKLGLSNAIGANASTEKPLSIGTLTLSSGTKNTVYDGTIENLLVSDAGQVTIGVATDPAPSITKSLVVNQNGIVLVESGTVTAMSVGLNGAVTIKGGTFNDVAQTATTAYVPCMQITSNAYVDIKDGEFNGKFVIDDNSNAVVDIHGGTFNGEFQRRSGLVSIVNVYGGTFNKDIYFGGSYTNFKIARSTEDVRTVIYIGDSDRTTDEFNRVCDELDYIIMAMPEPYTGKEVEVYLKSDVTFADGCCRFIDEGKKIKISSELTSSPVVALNGLDVDDAGTEVKISNIKLVPYSDTTNSGLVVDSGASVVLNNVVIGNSDSEAPKYYNDRALVLYGSDTVPATVSATNCTFYGYIDSNLSNIAFSSSALPTRGTLDIDNSTIELTGANGMASFTFDVKATPSAEHPNTIEAGKFTRAKFKTGDHASVTGGNFNSDRIKGQLLAYEGAYLTVNGTSVVMEDFCGWESSSSTPTYYPGVLANVYLVNGIFYVTDEDCFKSVANNIKYVNSETTETVADSVYIAVVPSAAVTLSDVIVTNTGKGEVVGETRLLFDVYGITPVDVILTATAPGKSYYDCESVVFTRYGNYSISGPVGFGGYWNTTGSYWEAGSKNVSVIARENTGSGTDSFVVQSASNAFFFDLTFINDPALDNHHYGVALYGGTYYIDGAENAVLAKFNELNSKPRIVTGITIALGADVDFSEYSDLNLDNLWNYSLTSYGSTRKNITLGEHSVVVDITNDDTPVFSYLNIVGNKTLFKIKGANASLNEVLTVDHCDLTTKDKDATDVYAAFEFVCYQTSSDPLAYGAATYNQVNLSDDVVFLTGNASYKRALAKFDTVTYGSPETTKYAANNKVYLTHVDRQMYDAVIKYLQDEPYNTVEGY